MKRPGFVSDALEVPSGKVFFLVGSMFACSLPSLLAAAPARCRACRFAAALTVLALSHPESRLFHLCAFWPNLRGRPGTSGGALERGALARAAETIPRLVAHSGKGSILDPCWLSSFLSYLCHFQIVFSFNIWHPHCVGWPLVARNSFVSHSWIDQAWYLLGCLF